MATADSAPNGVPCSLEASEHQADAEKTQAIIRDAYATHADIVRCLDELDAELTRLQVPVVAKLRDLLPSVIGISLGSQDSNDDFAKRLEALLKRLNLRVRCPKDGCRSALRCRPTKGSRHGFFNFRHYWNGQPVTHGGTTTVPQIELLDGTSLDDGGRRLSILNNPAQTAQLDDELSE